MAIYFEKNELQIIKKQVNKQIYIYINNFLNQQQNNPLGENIIRIPNCCNLTLNLRRECKKK